MLIIGLDDQGQCPILQDIYDYGGIHLPLKKNLTEP